jgi:Domain of unknown function (DUF6134)
MKSQILRIWSGLTERRRRIHSAAAGLAALLLMAVVSVSTSDADQPLPQNLEFDVVHESGVVGRHRITFRRDGDKLVVHSELAIKLKVLFFIVYRYQHTREEVWRDGKLIAFASTADDDGTPYDITGQARADGLHVTSGKESWILPADCLPASYWNISMVTGKGPLVDAQSGNMLDVKVVKVGQETIKADGKKIVATHYRLAAERPRHVWYDATGRWVKMRTIGRDGSAVEWVLK